MRLIAFVLACLVASVCLGGDQVCVVLGTAKASTGTQDFTCSGFGTPVGAIFLMSEATADDGAVDDFNMNIGFTDGTTDEVSNGSSEHNQSTSDAQTSLANAVIDLNTPGTSTTIDLASFDSWVTDGIRIDWTVSAGVAYKITAILLGGGVSAYVGDIVPCTAENCDSDITTVGFQPNAVITVASSITGSVPGAGANSIQILSFAIDDGDSVATMRSQVRTVINNKGTSDCRIRIDETYIRPSATLGYTVEDWDASGFSYRCRDGVCNGRPMQYIALAGIEVDAGTFTTPTSTGTDAVTGVGFTPQAVMMFGGVQTAIGQDTSGDAAGTGTYGVMDGTTEASYSMLSEDAVTTTNDASYYSTAAYDIRDPSDDSAAIKATYSSFDSDGFTLNYSDVLGSATYGFYFAFGPVPSAGGLLKLNPLDGLGVGGIN